MTTKFNSNSLLKESDFTGFVVNDRTTTVNYSEIKTSTIELFSSHTHAIGLAIKLNTRGMKVKPDDYFTVGGKTVMVGELVTKIHQQDGYSEAAAKDKTLGKDSKKTLVSLSRVARAFAAETSHAIAKKIVEVEKEIAEMATKANLPVKYAFLAAPWGMPDAEVKKYAEALHSFAQAFDSMISDAHGNGWCVGYSKRSHAETFANYLTFRKIDLD